MSFRILCILIQFFSKPFQKKLKNLKNCKKIHKIGGSRFSRNGHISAYTQPTHLIFGRVIESINNRYCQYLLPYQKSNAWGVCRRRSGHFIFLSILLSSGKIDRTHKIPKKILKNPMKLKFLPHFTGNVNIFTISHDGCSHTHRQLYGLMNFQEF